MTIAIGGVVVTDCQGWNPLSEGASYDHHHEPFSGKKAKVAEMAKTRKGTTALTQRRLSKARVRESMACTLLFIIPKR
jgi:hypothetical protein